MQRHAIRFTVPLPLFVSMFGRAQGGKQGKNDALFDSLKPVVNLVQNAYRRARPDDWNYALLMKCSA